MAAVLVVGNHGGAVLRLRGGVDQFNMNDGFRNERPSPMAIKRCVRAQAARVHARRHVRRHARYMGVCTHAAHPLGMCAQDSKRTCRAAEGALRFFPRPTPERGPAWCVCALAHMCASVRYVALRVGERCACMPFCRFEYAASNYTNASLGQLVRMGLCAYVHAYHACMCTCIHLRM